MAQLGTLAQRRLCKVYYWNVEARRVQQREERKQKGFISEKELSILLKLNHPGIVGFREPSIPLAMKQSLVVKDYFLKTVASVLKEQFEGKHGMLDARLVLKLSREVLAGLAYLHENERLLHGDLCAHNVVFKGNFETFMITSFEHCQRVTMRGNVIAEPPSAVTVYTGSERWAAPEVSILAGHHCTDRFSVLVDTYAFGMLLYEILAGTPPFSIPMDHRSNPTSLPLLPRDILPDSYKLFLLMHDLCVNPVKSRPSVELLQRMVEQPEETLRSAKATAAYDRQVELAKAADTAAEAAAVKAAAAATRAEMLTAAYRQAEAEANEAVHATYALTERYWRAADESTWKKAIAYRALLLSYAPTATDKTVADAVRTKVEALRAILAEFVAEARISQQARVCEAAIVKAVTAAYAAFWAQSEAITAADVATAATMRAATAKQEVTKAAAAKAEAGKPLSVSFKLVFPKNL